jgi:hypothetical protein
MKKSKDRFWDATAWHFEDKEWRAARKEQWGFVQSNLKIFARTELRGAYLKPCKELFFKGTISDELFDCNGAGELGAVLPLFIVWFHPNFDEIEKKKLIEWSISNFSSVKAMEASRFFCRLFWAKRSSKEFDISYGLFGGKESLISELFWGEPGIGAPFDQIGWAHLNHKVLLPRSEADGKTNMSLVNTNNVSYMYWFSVRSTFANPDKYSNDLGSFLFEHAQVAGSKHGNIDCDRVVAISVETILRFDSLNATVTKNPIAIRLKDFLMEKYLNRELHQDFLAIWDQVKAGTYEHED